MWIGSISCETVVVGYNAYQSPSVCNGSIAAIRWQPVWGYKHSQCIQVDERGSSR